MFSGLRYIIMIYIPRTVGRPKMFCSPILQFFLRPGEEGPATQPPIWSILVYMLLVETLNVDNEAVTQRLGIVVPLRDPPSLDLGSKTGTEGREYLGALTEVRILFFQFFRTLC